MNAEQEAPSITQLSYRLATLTHPGSLPKNEDACAVVKAEGATVIVVADGAGGHAYGEVASETVVRYVADYFSIRGRITPGPQILKKLLHGAQEALRSKITSSPKYFDMRSTGLILLATGEKLWVGHVGDSRAYLIRDGKPQLLTRDDTLVQTLVDIGQIEPEAAKKHSKANVLLQSLGDSRELEYHVSDATNMKVGDVLVACSDGLPDVVTDAEIARIAWAGKNSKAICQQLIDTAVANGAPDNVTVAVIKWRASTKKLSIAAGGTVIGRRKKATRSPDAFRSVVLFSVLLTVLGLAVAMKYKRSRRARAEAPVPARTMAPANLTQEPMPPVAPVVPEPAAAPAVAPVAAVEAPVANAPASIADGASPETTTTPDPAVAAPTPAQPQPEAVPTPSAITTASPAALLQPASVRLANLPAGASVLLDGVAVDPDANNSLVVEPGRRHRIVIRMAGRRDQRESVRVPPGESVTMRVSLQAEGEREPRRNRTPTPTEAPVEGPQNAPPSTSGQAPAETGSRESTGAPATPRVEHSPEPQTAPATEPSPLPAASAAPAPQ